MTLASSHWHKQLSSCVIHSNLLHAHTSLLPFVGLWNYDYLFFLLINMLTLQKILHHSLLFRATLLLNLLPLPFKPYSSNFFNILNICLIFTAHKSLLCPVEERIIKCSLLVFCIIFSTQESPHGEPELTQIPLPQAVIFAALYLYWTTEI